MRRRDFPGWRMVWTLSLTATVGYGALYYAFAVFVVPMQEDLSTSVGVLTGGFSVALAVSGIAAPLVGRLLDRFGARGVMTAGSVLGAAALVAWSRVESVAALYATFVVLGLAWATALYEPAFALVTRWFDRDRPRALLTLTVVGGFASTVFVPLAQLLVDSWGWRRALLGLAVVVGACAVPHVLVLRRGPADLGLVPDGRPAPGHGSGSGSGSGTAATERAAEPADTTGPQQGSRVPVDGPEPSAGAAWRSRPVVWLTVASVAGAASVTIVSVHLIAYLRQTGTEAGHAAWAAGALGLLSVTGRVLLTAAAARYGIAVLSAIAMAGQVVAAGALGLMPRPGGLIVFVVLFGLGFGVLTLARAALLAEHAPAGVYARLGGRQAFAVNAGRVVAPAATGAAVTASGGHWPLLAAVALCSAVAAAALLALATHRVRPWAHPGSDPDAGRTSGSVPTSHVGPAA